ncbi:Uncharacterized protein DBV15_11419 [Temnothorax longispinosus]|uniref:Uncharacterized protein n=1 Tax=Temnothorax longispinosus TaxID=300112 RepID=A0A4S2L711_9HYME|nr:Uncharacterized protein DBV15_11419 [Temnothorax longispinosus]
MADLETRSPQDRLVHLGRCWKVQRAEGKARTDVTIRNEVKLMLKCCRPPSLPVPRCYLNVASAEPFVLARARLRSYNTLGVPEEDPIRTVADLRLDRTTTGRARVSMRSRCETLSHASHTYEVEQLLAPARFECVAAVYTAVSYTHLDVYKRQVGILRARAFIVRGSPRGALHN